MSNENKNIMTTKEVAEYLCVCVNTVYRYVHEEGLPVLRFPGRRKFIFRKDLIDQWFEQMSKPQVYVKNEPVETVQEYGKLRVLRP